MSKKRMIRAFPCAAVVALAALSIAPRGAAQDLPKPGTSVPLSSYSFVSEYGAFKGAIVGGNPFVLPPNPTSTVIHAVVIPLVFTIADQKGKVWVFDPTQENSCDGNRSAVYHFRHSPLVQSSDLIFNGVDVGTYQYTPGYKRAMFWNFLNGRYVDDRIDWKFAEKVNFPPLAYPLAIVVDEDTPCQLRAKIANSFINEIIKSVLIPLLQAGGVISPTKFALFITRDVVESKNSPPTSDGGVTGGSHSHTPQPFSDRNPPQTYAWAQYDSTSYYVKGPDTSGRDIHPLSHEIAEWMMDPLNNNATPPWSNSETSSCASKFEVGDPLHTVEVPKFEMDDYAYHIQELAFFSWFFNQKLPSFGAGGKFSSHGYFTTPHASCP